MIKWIQYLRLVSIHVLARRTAALDVFRYMDTIAHKQIPALATQACVLTSKSHMLNFFGGCEACAPVGCDCDLWEPRIKGLKNIFCPEVRAKPKKQFHNKDSIVIGWPAQKRFFGPLRIIPHANILQVFMISLWKLAVQLRGG